MNYDLLLDLHKDGYRQGPGDDTQTKLALTLSGLAERPGPLKILDVGCGTGASTMVLAEMLPGDITALDLFPAFLEILEKTAAEKGRGESLTTCVGSMENLPFDENSFDVIWAEGSIYTMGFEKGIAYFKRFLKPGGILAVSEITWLTQERPEAIAAHWTREYPEIATAAKKIKCLEQQNYGLKGYFPLPVSCWRDHYYGPLQSRFETFLAKHGHSEEAQALIAFEREEIALHEAYHSYYSYGFYIAEKL